MSERITVREREPDPGQQWKCGDEFLPFHPQASHVPADYRDGWNRCYWMAVTSEREHVGINGLTEAEMSATASVMGIVAPPSAKPPKRRWTADDAERIRNVALRHLALRDAAPSSTQQGDEKEDAGIAAVVDHHPKDQGVRERSRGQDRAGGLCPCLRGSREGGLCSTH